MDLDRDIKLDNDVVVVVVVVGLVVLFNRIHLPSVAV